ncbi:MAG: tyrosine-type recombinase/integrase [Candidatus Dadabacteria bacterium]|nr:tyrosine-type recombinase/integrase [Candidatus Dadabacteria bacterium]
MTKIHNFEGNFKSQLKRIEKSKISKSNKDILFKFKDYLLSEGIGYAKITKYLQDLVKFERMLEKTFKRANEQDIRKVISEINQTNLSEHTKRGFKLIIKRFYWYLRGFKKRGIYPPEVEWISLTISSNHKKLPEELLTEEEIKDTIQNCETIRDKALIITLAESGARVSEIGNMQIKHVSFEEYGARLTVDGKTGTRKILVINSTPYLQEWINQHPKNDNPNSYLWYNPHGELLTYARIAAILKKAAGRAGIKKRIYPHLLRHSQATRMASIMSEAEMKQYFGWTQSSNMTGIYVHMSGKAVDDAILRANGIEIKKDKKEQKLKPTICLRCKIENQATNRCCRHCGLILDEEYAKEKLKEDADRTRAEKLISSLMKDEEVVEIIEKKFQI